MTEEPRAKYALSGLLRPRVLPLQLRVNLAVDLFEHRWNITIAAGVNFVKAIGGNLPYRDPVGDLRAQKKATCWMVTFFCRGSW